MSLPVVLSSFGMSEKCNNVKEKKCGYFNCEVKPGFTIRLRRNIDLEMDPKKLKRIISNRVAAQKSRWKKLQYTDELLKKCIELERQASLLRFQLKMASEHKQYLESEQRELKSCISTQIQRAITNEGETEAYRVEIERLIKTK